MTRRYFYRAFMAALMLICSAAGQELRHVSPEEAVQHIIKRTEPRYPQLAEMARIQGAVIVRVTIDERGGVTEAKPVSGHPMLIEAAVPAVKSWRFAPFMDNGSPSPVSAEVSLMFSLAPGAERHRDYLRQEAECNKELQSRNFPAGEPVCGKALKIAAGLPRGYEADKLRAYGNAGTVAFELRKMPEALEDFKQQLDAAQQALKPGSRQMIQVRANLVHTYMASGQMPEADAGYTELEKAVEAAEAELDARSGQMTPYRYGRSKASFAHDRQVILLEHAALLRKMGRLNEANAMEQRANANAPENK
jgi:TonB family protein